MGLLVVAWVEDNRRAEREGRASFLAEKGLGLRSLLFLVLFLA